MFVKLASCISIEDSIKYPWNLSFVDSLIKLSWEILQTFWHDLEEFG